MNTKINTYLTPIAVVIGALFIAGAIYWGEGSPRPAGGPSAEAPDQAALEKALDNVSPVTAQDHIRGNPNAEVIIIEYSDTECPFCKRFQETMRQVMNEYGDSGKVAWVYRHFPLDQLHQKARSEAVAFECANELGGNEVFWKYADRLFEITPSNDGLDAAELPKIATYVGLDASAFSACLSSGRYDAHIEAEVQNAVATGGQGTPWSIVVTRSGKKYPLSGALPYEEVKQLIEMALKEQ